MNQDKMNIYSNLIEKSNVVYLVKHIYDNNTELVVTDDKIRYELTVKYPQLTDLYIHDLIFEYIKYDVYINFLYKIKKQMNSKDPEYTSNLKEAYQKIFNSLQFKKVLFTLLNIKDEIFLQERYLNLIIRFYNKMLSSNILHFNPRVECLEQLISNYSSVITTFNYKNIVKYINNDQEDLFIYSKSVREGLKLEHSSINFMYDFENDDLKKISNIIYENYIKMKISPKYKFVGRVHLENIIYQNEACITMIKNLLDMNENIDKYIKIIINYIFTDINYPKTSF